MAGRFPFRRSGGSSGGPERPVDVFVRGLFSGALVGAVIAGSAIWERRHRRRAAQDAAAGPEPPVAEAEPVADAAPPATAGPEADVERAAGSEPPTR